MARTQGRRTRKAYGWPSPPAKTWQLLTPNRWSASGSWRSTGAVPLAGWSSAPLDEAAAGRQGPEQGVRVEWQQQGRWRRRKAVPASTSSRRRRRI